MQHHPSETYGLPQQGGIALVDPLRRRQQWLQGRRGNDLGETPRPHRPRHNA